MKIFSSMFTDLHVNRLLRKYQFKSFEVRTFVWDTSNPSDYWFIALKFDHIWWQICELKDDNVKKKLKVLKSISLFERKTFLSIVFCIMLFLFHLFLFKLRCINFWVRTYRVTHKVRDFRAVLRIRIYKILAWGKISTKNCKKKTFYTSKSKIWTFDKKRYHQN